MAADPTPDIDDPWAGWATPARGPRPAPMALLWLGAWALAVFGPVLRHLDDDVSGRAVGVAAMVAAWLAVSAVAPARWWAPVVRAAMAVALVVVAPTGAHKAALVAILAAAAAHAAIVRWEPLPGWPPRAVQVAGLAVPVIALAEVLWWRRGPTVGVLALLVLAFPLVEAYHRRPAWVERPDRAVRRATVALGVAVSSVVLFLFALPFLYLPGLFGRLWELRPGARHPRTGWQDRGIEREAERNLRTRPFAPTRPADRSRRYLVGVAAAAVLAVALLQIRADRTEAPAQQATPGGTTATTAAAAADGPAWSDLPAYEGVEWADALQDEQQRFLGSLYVDPALGISATDFQSETTNVVDGVRRSVQPTCDCPRSLDVWLVGGSAAFGLGQRDDHTIASELVRLAEQDGIALRIQNLAVPGRTIWQDYLALSKQFGMGPDPAEPDLIVDYGGFNDSLGALVGAANGNVDLRSPTVLDPNQVGALAQNDFELPDDLTIEETSTLAAERYQDVQELIRRMALAHGASTEFVFHPDALASPEQFEPVADAYAGIPASAGTVAGDQLEATSQLLRGATWDLRHLYDDEERSVFVDWAHTNEAGATIAAQAVYDQIRPLIDTLAQ